MLISQINQTPRQYAPKTNVNTFRHFETPRDVVTFKGHLYNEKILYNKANLILRHETSLFRDMQTKNFVKDYILRNFGDKTQIKMVVGACSSGEEAFTYSMLLSSAKSKLSILGFDLSKRVIEQAKTGKLMMQEPNKESKKIFDLFTDSFGDSFLCFSHSKNITPEQLEQKKLFDDFFEVTQEVYNPKESLGQKIKSWFMVKCLKMPILTYDTKIIKAKNGKFENCTFKKGDILKLADVTGGEKQDVITFSNALYHLTTDDVANGLLRVSKENAEDVVRNVAKNVKENLNPNGIFVLGEHEDIQMINVTIVPKVFKELGFEPLNKTEKHMENVWRLVK